MLSLNLLHHFYICIAKDILLYFLEDNIHKNLSSIVTKVYENKGIFSEEEETLISLSSVPIIAKIEMDLSTYSSSQNTIHNQTEFIEALCFDVVTNYLAMLLLNLTLVE